MFGLAVFAACCWLAACKPTPGPQSVHRVKVVSEKPRCEKLGVVEGVAGNDRAARIDALDQAVERGATHAVLEPAHPDLEDGMTMIVTATIFACPSPDEEFPPDGYQ